MANPNVKSGFRVLNKIGGGYVGEGRLYYANAAETLYKGDMVKLATGSTTDGKYQKIAKCAAGDVPIGIVTGFLESKDKPAGQNYKKSGDALYVYVQDDHDIEFSGIVHDADWEVTDTSQNANIKVSEGNTSSGISGMYIDAASINTTNTLVLQLRAVTRRVRNESGAYAEVVCRYNLHANFPGRTAVS